MLEVSLLCRLVLEGVAREQAITRLVTSHVAKAEKARRHGRELSFILPHNAVDNFAPLFSAIEHEINTRASRLGISSYGVSMTTLEEVRNSRSAQNLADLVTGNGDAKDK
jgi:ATP-binding cassette subfamily A (ABC1) protein 5